MLPRSSHTILTSKSKSLHLLFLPSLLPNNRPFHSSRPANRLLSLPQTTYKRYLIRARRLGPLYIEKVKPLLAENLHGNPLDNRLYRFPLEINGSTFNNYNLLRRHTLNLMQDLHENYARFVNAMGEIRLQEENDENGENALAPADSPPYRADRAMHVEGEQLAFLKALLPFHPRPRIAFSAGIDSIVMRPHAAWPGPLGVFVRTLDGAENALNVRGVLQHILRNSQARFDSVEVNINNLNPHSTEQCGTHILGAQNVIHMRKIEKKQNPGELPGITPIDTVRPEDLLQQLEAYQRENKIINPNAHFNQIDHPSNVIDPVPHNERVIWPLLVGGKVFKTAAELRHRCRGLLRNAHLTRPIQDEQFMIELLKFHPNAKELFGESGIRHIYVGVTDRSLIKPKLGQVLCFRLVRNDGTAAEFSYMTIIHHLQGKTKVDSEGNLVDIACADRLDANDKIKTNGNFRKLDIDPSMPYHRLDDGKPGQQQEGSDGMTYEDYRVLRVPKRKVKSNMKTH